MREDFLVIIDWQPHVIRAGIGMGEVIPRPTVELEARVALRRDASTSGNPSSINSTSTPRRWNEYLVGQALEEAERSGEELDVIWPLELGPRHSSKNGSSRSNGVASAVNGSASDGDAAASSSDGMVVDAPSTTTPSTATATATAAATGKAKMLEAEGVKDWTALEALFRHLITVSLGLSNKPVNYMFLLAHPPSLSPATLELLTQQFFEQLCVTNLLLVERPLVQLVSCNALSGIVIDVGRDFTDVSVVIDCQTVSDCHLRHDVGERDCDLYLEKILLERNTDLPKLLSIGNSTDDMQGLDEAAITIPNKNNNNKQVSKAIQTLIKIMKEGEYIRYTSATPKSVGGTAAGVDGNDMDDEEEDEEGISDVAKAIASGKVNKIINKDMAAGGAAGSLGAAEGQEVQVIEEEEEDDQDGGDGARMDASTGAGSTSAEAGIGTSNANGSGGASGEKKTKKGNKLSIPNPVSTSLPNIIIGNERNRYCEPLFDRSVLAKVTLENEKEDGHFQTSRAKADGPTLGEVVNAAVMRIAESDKRAGLWENVVVTGSMARVKGFAPAVISSLHRYLPQSTNPLATTYNDNNQPQDAFRNRRAKHLKTPEYFSEFRERPDLTSFLGGCIYAKFGFQESQGGEWLTKQNYNQYGPKIATMLQSSWEL